MKIKNYNLALTPSTSAVGHVEVDDDLNILEPVHHQKAIGVAKFGEGETAEARRLARSARRTTKRRANRINHYFNEIMKPEIDKVDPLMFDRIKQAGLSPLDERKEFRTVIFDRPNVASYYHKQFPTIWHLQKYLMITDEKADIRLIYWALHSLLKHRGHFFNTTPMSQFKPGKLNLKDDMLALDDYNDLEGLSFAVANSPEIEKVIKDRSMRKKEKIAELQTLIVNDVPDKDLAKRNNKIITQIVNAIMGNSFHLNFIFDMELDKLTSKAWSFKLDDPELDTKFDAISGSMTNNQIGIFETLQKIYSAISLLDILNGSSSVVDAKIALYDKHKRDLNLYFKFLNTLPDEMVKTLKAGYTLYIGNRKKDLVSARKLLKVNVAKNFSRDDFYKLINKELKIIDKKGLQTKFSEKVGELVAQNNFLLVQRSSDNAFIPYQLNAITFNKILENQGKYYDFLVKPNPAKKDRKNVPYELSQLMQFTIPYYVGPLVTPEEQVKSGIPKTSRFAWMVRKDNGAITPWNFYDKVDIEATADKFIKRSIAKDSYLLSELVLPKHSLLYEKYEVFNELSNVSLDGKKLSGGVKQILFNEVFKKTNKVNTSRILKALAKHNIPGSKITGLSNPEEFTSSLQTYNAWKKYFPNQIDNFAYQQDLEKMIEWSTVFEDHKILAKKLDEIEWLDDDQKKFVANTRLRGWGRLSKRLLTGLKDNYGKSIMQRLETTKANFQQIVYKPEFREQIDKISQAAAKNQSLEDILANSYTSPSNRKAIRKTMSVVDEYIKLNHGKEPDKIFLMFQRSEQEKGKQTEARSKQLNRILSQLKADKSANKLFSKQLADEFSNAIKKSKYKLNDKQYFYFQQLGRDALTGEVIDYDELYKYTVLHIIPRSKLTDDSQNNKVLTKYKIVDGSVALKFGNSYSDALGMPIKAFWTELNRLKLIPKGKLLNLTTDFSTLNKYQRDGYIARQLVETQQIVKLLATIMQSRFKHTKIIEVRNSQVANIRYQFDYFRIKNLNEYYRGFDAYLAAVVGTYLYKVYPKARRLFVYGQYLKPKKTNQENQDIHLDSEKKSQGFNFLWNLLYGKQDQIFVNGTDVIAFNRKDLITKMNTVYNYKSQKISLAIDYHNGAMFKATLFPRNDRDTAKTRKLIPKKKDYDTDIYGGYTSNVDGYMLLAEIIKRDGNKQYGFYGVPSRLVSELDTLKKTRYTEYEEKLKEIIKPELGVDLKKIKKIKILKNKVPFNQVIIDKGSKFFITSTSYRWNYRQLILSAESQQTLMDLVVDPDFSNHKARKDARKNADERLIKVYEEILYQVKNYMPMFVELHRCYEKLVDAQKTFKSLKISDKAIVLNQILILLHSNATSPVLEKLGYHTRFTLGKKHNLISENAVLVTQSITGLKENHVSIKQML